MVVSAGDVLAVDVPVLEGLVVVDVVRAVVVVWTGLVVVVVVVPGAAGAVVPVCLVGTALRLVRWLVRFAGCECRTVEVLRGRTAA